MSDRKTTYDIDTHFLLYTVLFFLAGLWMVFWEKGGWGRLWEGVFGDVNSGASEVSLESNDVD